jgi:hypothetical protein
LKAWLSHCCVHSNKGGGVLIHSRAQGVLRHSQINMNHAGFEFGDVDVDSDSEAVLEHCELVGNGEHGREQYRVLAVQQRASLTLRHCEVRCEASSFGTGIEVQRGGMLRVSHSTIHGCSGSGVLLRDEDTVARLEHSRVSRVGARARQREAEEKEKTRKPKRSFNFCTTFTQKTLGYIF